MDGIKYSRHNNKHLLFMKVIPRAVHSLFRVKLPYMVHPLRTLNVQKWLQLHQRHWAFYQMNFNL